MNLINHSNEAWLIYSDYLEERGESLKAERVRYEL